MSPRAIHGHLHPRQDGFNLLELMITVTIAAVVLGIGVPSFTEFVANNRMASAANDLVTSIHTARTEAVKRRGTVTLCASSDWNDGSPDCDLGAADAGWIVFFDADGDVSVDPGDTVIFTHPPFAQGITFTIDAGAQGYLQFGGNGFPQTAAAGAPITNVQLCDGRGDRDTGAGIAAGRWIQIGITGRPQLYRMRADVQANPNGGCA
jgi:type IV fimbrial biogenesis protein FimT